MKKTIILLICLLFCITSAWSKTSTVDSCFTKVQLQYHGYDNGPVLNPYPRSPKAPVIIYYDENHLYLNGNLLGYEMDLTDFQGHNVYHVLVNSTVIDLPQNLKGEYIIQFILKENSYYGSISF